MGIFIVHGFNISHLIVTILQNTKIKVLQNLNLQLLILIAVSLPHDLTYWEPATDSAISVPNPVMKFKTL